MDEFSTIDTLERALRRWWLVALLVICGGGVGWLAHLAQPPLYEATAVFSAVVDFKQAGQIPQLEQDTVINVVSNTIFSTAITDQVVADAKAQGIPIDTPTLLKMATVERESQIQILRVRNSNPKDAQTLANLWANRAETALKADLQHAINADAFTQQLSLLNMCLAQVNLPNEPSTPCSNASSQDRTAQIQALTSEISTERGESGGLTSWLVFDIQQKADLPTHPISYNANIMILAGGFIGFLLAIWLVAGPLEERLFRLIPQRSLGSATRINQPQPGQSTPPGSHP